MELIDGLGVIIACCALTVVLSAQTNTPPAPKPMHSPTSAPSEASPSEPTLEDTAKFIADETPPQSSVVFSVSFSGEETNSARAELKWEEFSMSGCTVHGELVETMNYSRGKPAIRTLHLPPQLSALDPKLLEIENHAMVLHKRFLAEQHTNVNVTSVPEVFDLGYSLNSLSKDENGNLIPSYRIWVSLFVSDNKPLAERVARAWVHAIVLCGGGKNQLF